MELYAYISLQCFVEGCDRHSSEQQLTLTAGNLFYTIPRHDFYYGLSLLRNAIGIYETQKHIPLSQSKQRVYFFRQGKWKLVGPEMDIYMLSLYENEAYIPEWLPYTHEPYLKLAFDYETLAEHCLLENMFLVRCKYDEKQITQTFADQMEREYDKFFFDEEHTGFTADSRFFSLMCNACLEVKEPRLAAEKEWRLAVLRNSSDVDYRYADGRLEPTVPLSLPLASIRKVTLFDRGDDNELNLSALADFMQCLGLPPERYLDGMIE